MGQGQGWRVSGLVEAYEWATGNLDKWKLFGQSGVLCLQIFNGCKNYQKTNQFGAVMIIVLKTHYSM